MLGFVDNCHTVVVVIERASDRDGIAKDDMDADINVHGEGRNVEAGDFILERIDRRATASQAGCPIRSRVLRLRTVAKSKGP